MGKLVITIKVLPNDPELDLNKLLEKVASIITEKKGEVGKHQIEPIAFGLKALYVFFLIDESLGVEDVADEIKKLEEVDAVEVIDMRKEFDL